MVKSFLQSFITFLLYTSITETSMIFASISLASTQLASTIVVLNIDTMMQMTYFGITYGSKGSLGDALGRRQPVRAKNLSKLLLLSSTVVGVLVGGSFMVSRRHIASLFSLGNMQV
jgi:Na+-driven multidrug efflux pump